MYKAFEKSVIYKGFKYDYGTGGVHGCVESGIYESDEDNVIIQIISTISTRLVKSISSIDMIFSQLLIPQF